MSQVSSSVFKKHTNLLTKVRLKCASNPRLRGWCPRANSAQVCPTSSNLLQSLSKRKVSIAKGI